MIKDILSLLISFPCMYFYSFMGNSLLILILNNFHCDLFVVLTCHLSGFNTGKKSRRQCWEKYCLIKLTPDYDYGVQTNFTLHLFFILLLLCSYQKHETAFFYYLISKEIKFGHTQISVPKIDILMLKTFCTNPWVFEVSWQGHPFWLLLNAIVTCNLELWSSLSNKC